MENFVYQDVAVLEAILRMDDLRVADANWSPFLPFMSWLIPSLNPEVTVDLEFEVQSSFHTIWEVAQPADLTSKCIVVLLAVSGRTDQGRQAEVRRFKALISDSATRLGGTLESAIEEDDVLASGFPRSTSCTWHCPTTWVEVPNTSRNGSTAWLPAVSSF